MALRMTNQREIILKELRSGRRHMTADELYERVRKRMPRISLATVYRNLETLAEAGVIAKIEMSGRQKRFDAEVTVHDHIYCITCHRVDNITVPRDELGYSAILSDKGYTVTGFRVEFVGICPACRGKKSERQSDEHG